LQDGGIPTARIA